MVRSFWKRTLVVALSCGGASWGMAQQPPAATPPPSGKIITIVEPGKGKQECAILREWPMPDGNIGRILMNLATGEEMTVIDPGHSSTIQPPSPYHAAGLTARIFHWGPNHVPPPGSPMPPEEMARLVPEPAAVPVVVNADPMPTPMPTSAPMPMTMEPTPAAVHRGLFGSSWELSWRKSAGEPTMPSGPLVTSGTAVVSTVPSGTTVVNGDTTMEAPPPTHRTPFARLFGKKSTDDQVMPVDSMPATTVTQLSPAPSGMVGPETKVTVIPLDMDDKAPEVTKQTTTQATTAAAPPKKHLWPFHWFSGPSEPKDAEAMATGSIKDPVVTHPAKDTVTATQPLDSNPWNRYKSPYTSLTAANSGAVATSAGQSSDWRRSWGSAAPADGQGSLAVKTDDKSKKPAKPADATAAADPKATNTKPTKPTETAKADPPKKDTPTVAVKVDVAANPPAPAPSKPRVEVTVDLPRAEEHKVDPLSNPDQYSRKPLDGMVPTPAVPAALASNSTAASARGVAKSGKAPADVAMNKPISRRPGGALASSKPGPELLTDVAAAPAKPATVVKATAKTSAPAKEGTPAVVNASAKVTLPAKEATPAVAKVQVDNKVQPASADVGIASTQPPVPLGAQSVLAAYDARAGGVVYLPVPMVTLPPSSYVPPPSAPTEPEKPVAQAPAAKVDPTQDDLSANAFGPALAPQPQPEEQMAINAFSRQQAPGPMPGMYPQVNMMPPMMMGPMGQPVYQAAGYGYPAGMVVPAMAYPGAMPMAAPVMVASAPVQVAGPQTVPQLLYSLRESLYPSARQRAAESLATFEGRDHPEVIDALLLAAREDPAASVRAGCVRSLSHVGNGLASVKTTIEGLRTDPDQRVRQEAEEALTKINGSASPVNPVLPASALTHPQ